MPESSPRPRLLPRGSARAVALVLLAALVGGVVSTLVELRQHPRYRAVTQVVLQPPASGAEDGALSVDQQDRAVQTELVSLNGADLLSTARADLGLARDVRVDATQVGSTDVVEVAASAADGDAARRLAARVVQLYEERRADVAEEQRTETQARVDQRLAELRGQVEAVDDDDASAQATSAALLAEITRLTATSSRVASDAEQTSGGVQVVQPPTESTTEVTTSPPRAAVLGALLGTLVGVGLALLLVRQRAARSPA